MEFEGKEYGVCGNVPEFGAIFMSNNETKEECFRRRLLGLPSGLAHFVKQVKAGMLLFLFEFERRELYGVFRASSNGAMNIVPHAFSSSGKQFPAQVNFTPLWHCSPLSEDEFSDAIRENYFSTKKFNFGLSEDQVHKLLYLFGSRKLKPLRHFSRHFTRESRRAADDEGSKISNKVEDELNCDRNRGSAISTNYFANHLSKCGADSSVQNQFEPSSTFCKPVKQQVVKLLCPVSAGNRVGSLAYDPDGTSIDSRCSLSNGIVPPHISNAGNIPSSGSQSFHLYEVLQGTRRFTYFNAGLGNSISLPSPNFYQSSWRTMMPPLEATYSEDMASNYSENEGYRGSSVPRPSSAPVHFSDSGNVHRMTEGSRTLSPSQSPSFSPSHYPSFVLDYKHHEASQEKDHRMPQYGINESLLANVPMSKEGQNQLQGHLYSVEFKSTDQHINSSLKPNGCCSSGEMYSDFQTKRESVFSRLTLASKAHNDDNVATSVNEVMSMLHQSHHQWLRMRNSKDDGEHFRMKKQTSLNSRSRKHSFQKIFEDVKTDISVSEENCDQFAEKTCFVDFRRRSEVQKIHKDDTKTCGCNGSAESECFSGVMRKRRKLIRPNFNVNVDTPQNVEMLAISDQTSHEDKDIIENVDEDGKEVSQNDGIETMPSSVEELVAAGCNGCEMDFQQRVENGNENEALTSSCEIITGQLKTISSN